MAYGLDEYPFTNLHDTNLLEVLCLAKKLKDEYDGLVSKLNQMETKVNGYQSYIDQKVSSEVDADIATYQASVNSQLSEMKSEISTFKSQVVSERTQFETRINNEIEDFRNQVNEGIEQHRKEYEAAMQAMRTEISEKTKSLESKIDQLVATTDSRLDSLINSATTQIDKLVSDTHEHLHKVLAFMRADFNQLKQEFQNYKDGLNNDVTEFKQGVDEVLNAVTADISDLNTKLELADRDITMNRDGLADVKEDLDNVYAELMEKINQLNKPTGNLTNPVTGEVEDADKVVTFLYYTLLQNHIPDVQNMGAWSPKVSEMENDKTPLRETSVNMRPWYEEPRSPITGKKTSPKALLSSLHRNPNQKSNKELKKMTVQELNDKVETYGDFKTTEALDKVSDQLTQLTKVLTSLKEKVNNIDERLKVIESG